MYIESTKEGVADVGATVFVPDWFRKFQFRATFAEIMVVYLVGNDGPRRRHVILGFNTILGEGRTE
jgi:hypothetical protein